MLVPYDEAIQKIREANEALQPWREARKAAFNEFIEHIDEHFGELPALQTDVFIVMPESE